MPTLPKDILGHTQQQAQLLHDIAKENVAHAYLFSGPKHIGKSTVARWFAVELLSIDAPDKKTVHTQIEKLVHPDFLALDLLWAEGQSDNWDEIGQYSNIQQKHRSKAPTAKTNSISIDDIRHLISDLHETAQSAFRVCLITDIERMHAEASNALLKIIEEPPPTVIFLLTTSDVDGLLPTIRSRARIMHFHPLAKEQMASLIHEEEKDDAELLLHLAGGAPGTLIRFQEAPERLRESRKLHARARSFWGSASLTERLSLCMPAQESRQASEEFLLHLGIALREHSSIEKRASWIPHFTALSAALHTNTNRGLALSRFALAVSRDSC